MKKTILLLAMIIMALMLCSAALADTAVLLDNDTVTLSVTEMTPGEDAFVMKLKAVNKSGNAIVLSVSDAFLNNCGMDTRLKKSIAAGETADITLDWKSLAAKGVTGEVTKAELMLALTDPDAAAAYPDNTYTVYPMGEDKAGDHSAAPMQGSAVIDNELITVTAASFGYNAASGFTAVLCFTAKDEDCSVDVLEAIRCNGSTAVPYNFYINTLYAMYRKMIPAGHHYVTAYSVSPQLLRRDGISALTDVTFHYSITGQGESGAWSDGLFTLDLQ